MIASRTKIHTRSCAVLAANWLALIVLTIGVGAFAQTPGGGTNAATSPADSEAHWRSITMPELLATAETGNLAAQYWYWVRESNAARDDAQPAIDQATAYGYQLTTADRTTFYHEAESQYETKWKNATEAELKQATESGDHYAESALSHFKQNQRSVRLHQAVVWLVKSAESGFPFAESEVAYMYLGKSGWVLLEANQTKGLDFLQRAAMHGVGSSQYQLGLIYVEGKLVPPDFTKAIEYFRSAADQNGPRSQYELGLLYANGYAAPRNESDKPVALFRKSAAQNYSPAWHELAERYRTGLGVPMDYVQAIQCYYLAGKTYRDAGNLRDSIDAAIMKLLDDEYHPKPSLPAEFSAFAKVLSSYSLATQREDSAAMRQIGDWYLSGRYVPKDYLQAYHWYDGAAKRGDAKAAGQRERAKSLMTPQQVQKIPGILSGPY